ncbi:Helix-turn-helix domain-containing protein [Streptoalloteichus tenebrarius]|uniref:Helix-turn-helix domain-containing protein n=1 Tax=Streptoalloteichus tenebrarius (strain ATCC 17920 / DSM 40477 / JCM 4838 / CBS 697.72 / NBRC 16177 / NCIMB 11028 / NRRL B-12390 / A12253. 1 / ISP 5477) TaxID=1933 RepID=A0ABT1I1L7_STRSD|nr:helix-turn-helix domain-containing protein [Streptoalloteichus tenebrarius]MCP2261687.1 Helix-turn-helix domain-containing protein [Streptoalloteichus tenebrarius]
MLRIIVGPADLRRIRLVREADSLVETVLSLRRESDERSPRCLRWQRATFPDLPVAEVLSGTSWDLVIDRAAAVGTGSCPGLESRLSRLRGVADHSPLLASAIVHWWHTVVSPDWAGITTAVAGELAAQAALSATAGATSVLGRTHRSARWSFPVLEIESPRETEWRLRGRGMLLMPTAAPVGEVILTGARGGVPVLIYPVDLAAERPHGNQGDGASALARLLGRTRATVLESIGSGCSTTVLAGRIGMSLASASQHVAVLRGAGLVTTTRVGASVRHTLSPLGEELLESSRRPSTSDNEDVCQGTRG